MYEFTHSDMVAGWIYLVDSICSIGFVVFFFFGNLMVEMAVNPDDDDRNVAGYKEADQRSLLAKSITIMDGVDDLHFRCVSCRKLFFIKHSFMKMCLFLLFLNNFYILIFKFLRIASSSLEQQRNYNFFPFSYFFL